MSTAKEDDPFYLFGEFAPFEARKILQRLEEEKIRFEIDVDTSGHARCKPVMSDNRDYRSDSRIKLYIHRADESKFREISGEFFKV